VTESYLEVTSFHRKSPESGCRRQETRAYSRFHLLQGCSSQEEKVTWQEMTSRDLRWSAVTRKWRHLTGSLPEVAIEGQKLPYTVHFTSYTAVGRRKRQSRDRKWCHVTSGDRRWRNLSGSHLEVAVDGQKRLYTEHFTSYKAVARRRRQWRDRKWRHVTSGDRKWPKSDVIWRKSPQSGCRRPKTRACCTFRFIKGLLQRCSSRQEAITWQADVTWFQVTGIHPEVTSFHRKSSGSGCRSKNPVYCSFHLLQSWRHLTGSLLKVAVGQKHAYTVLFPCFKAVGRWRTESRHRKWRHETSGDRNWLESDVIWPKVTWKWL